MAVGDTYVFPGSFLSKATGYFSHMLLQKWEAKIRRKEKSPQPGIELTTTRSHKSDTLTTEPPGRDSAANKDMMSKIWTDGDTTIWLSRKHCGKRRNFFFSHNVYRSCLLLIRENEYLWGNGLIMSSANAFKLDRSIFLSCDIEFKIMYVTYQQRWRIVNKHIFFIHVGFGFFFFFQEKNNMKSILTPLFALTSTFDSYIKLTCSLT